MLLYAVYHTARAFHSDRFSTPLRMDGTLTDSYQEALEFAEILTSEHADLILSDKRTPFGLRYATCGNGHGEKTGYTLRTSNGSDVWYTVKQTESE